MSLTDTEIQLRAREIRAVTEPLAGGVYFAPEAQEQYRAAGLDYFESYFCSRGACLGQAPWSVICAAFAAFKPSAVEAAVTGGWSKTTAETILVARERGATAQLERILDGIAAPADIERATDILFSATDGVDPSGRVLFAGLSVLDRPTSPLGAFWRAADLVREHRGDGHIASWIPHVDSTEITVLTEIAWGIPRRMYVFTRGWDETDVGRGRGAPDRAWVAHRRRAHGIGRHAPAPDRDQHRPLDPGGRRAHRRRPRRADHDAAPVGRGRGGSRRLSGARAEPRRRGLSGPAVPSTV